MEIVRARAYADRESARVIQHNQDPTGSAFKAHGDRREYNVYIETAAVEDAWCRSPEWPLSSQVVPLLVSLEIALKILDDCLRETGARQYVNDASKAETVAACVGSLLTLIAEIAFEYGSDPPPALFGPPSRRSAWTTVMAGLDRIGNGTRLQADLRCRYDLAVRMLGFDLGLMGTPGLDYDKWVRPDDVHRLYGRIAGSATSRIPSSSACTRYARAFSKRCSSNWRGSKRGCSRPTIPRPKSTC